MKRTLLPALLLSALVTTTAVAQSNAKIRLNGATKIAKFEMPKWAVEGTDYVAGKINLKLKPEFRNSWNLNTYLQSVLQEIGASNTMKRMFPLDNPPEVSTNKYGQKLVDLSLVFELNYTSEMPIELAVNKLLSSGIFEYAEPHYIPKMHAAPYVPNDANGSQYYLTDIKAFDAWGINTTTARGDSSVVIGIVDSGTNLTHGELSGKLKKNLADPVNGNDDDGNGLVDDYNGWDFADNDNNPTYSTFTTGYHGVASASLAAAATDNSTGMAGVGFNCKYLPVKMMDASGALVTWIQPMKYAADRGAQIINCSFGGATLGNLGQEIVDYCAINKGALIVASSGNTYADSTNYPAGYYNVLSVGGTGQSTLAVWNDFNGNGTSYNYFVDICAPAKNLYALAGTTFSGGFTGTSGSAPIVSGAAGVIKSYYPSYTMAQVGALIKSTADDMYASNSGSLANKLGAGRVNMYNAMTVTNKPGMEMTVRDITDGNDNTFSVNDTLKITGTFINYLAATSNLTVSLSTTSAYMTAISGSTSSTLGAISTLATKQNASPFKFKIAANTPTNHTAYFKVTYTDAGTGYSAYEYFKVTVNVNYINVVGGEVNCSIGNDGNIGYTAANAGNGTGFTFTGSTSTTKTMIYEAGLIIGNSATAVSSCVRGQYSNALDADFQNVVPVQRTFSGFADSEVSVAYNDNGNTGTKLNVQIDQTSYGWSTSGNTRFVIHKFEIKNTGSTTLSNFHVGLFVDYDVDYDLFDQNKVAYDATNKLLYTYATVANKSYAGTKLLSSNGTAFPYGIDNIAGGGGGIDISDANNGYSKADKFTTISTSRTTAGQGATGNDCATTFGTGPFTIAAGQTITVGYAMIAGNNLSNLQTSAAAAQVKWDGIVAGTEKMVGDNKFKFVNFPNPFSQTTNIAFSIADNSNVDLSVFDAQGNLVQSLATGNLASGKYNYTFDASNLAQGLYICKLTVNGEVFTEKLTVAK